MTDGKRGRSTRTKDKSVVIYHDMRVEESFEKCATRLFKMVRMAQERSPGKKRVLYLDVQGHRNDAGGFDHDAYELLTHVLLGFLAPYLSEIYSPLFQRRNPQGQCNYVPDELQITYPDGSHSYEHDSLVVRSREAVPDSRVTRPSVQAIADYLGLDEPSCLICWGTPVERAHAVPESLGGSNDVRNFALLCRRHHAESPDVSDAEAFWSWVDYACERDAHEKRLKLAAYLSDDVSEDSTHGDVKNVDHFENVRAELIQHYQWSPDDFDRTHWVELMQAFHIVMDAATGTHFGIKKKASTEAWAFDVAKRRLDARRRANPGV